MIQLGYMDLNGIYARQNFWTKVKAYDVNGTLLFESGSPNHFLFNRTTSVLKVSEPDKPWLTISNTGGTKMNNVAYEVDQQGVLRATITVARFGRYSKNHIAIRNGEDELLGSVDINAKSIAGYSLADSTYSTASVNDVDGKTLATIASKDRHSKFKIVVHPTYEISDAPPVPEEWEAILIAILILTAVGLIIA